MLLFDVLNGHRKYNSQVNVYTSITNEEHFSCKENWIFFNCKLKTVKKVKKVLCRLEFTIRLAKKCFPKTVLKCVPLSFEPLLVFRLFQPAMVKIKLVQWSVTSIARKAIFLKFNKNVVLSEPQYQKVVSN